MNLKLLFSALFTFCFFSILAQNNRNKWIEKSDFIQYHPNQKNIQFIRFEEWIDSENKENFLKDLHQVSNHENFELYQTETDKLGFAHFRFQQNYKGLMVEDGVFYVHTKNQKIASANGEYYPNIQVDKKPKISKNQAFEAAKLNINAKKYIWQNDDVQAQNQNLPDPKLLILPLENDYKLAYKIDIYAIQPMSRNYVYIDAQTGEILQKRNRIHHADSIGQAHTKYSGVQNITTDFTGSNFRLRESGRGNGIETYNLNNLRYTDTSAAFDFIDTDNIWNSTQNDNDAALDVHWGMEKTYDYFLNEHGRNSIDNKGYLLKSYVHVWKNYSDAYWNGSDFLFGDGQPGYFTPFTSLDIVAHEFTHGITEHSARLILYGESGALNESFSDIFGITLDFYANPSTANWLFREQISVSGLPARSLENPNLYNQPDTYFGNHWSNYLYNDGGARTNSGVQNFWFYLLANGGSGTNDNGDIYSVSGIGIEKAADIAFRNLTVYLSPYSQYVDARTFSIQSAIDLFGACSPEVIAVTNAWHAVGVGNRFNNAVIADFDVNQNYSCTVPFSIDFINKSTNANSFLWDFGDGTNSTNPNPSHVYNSPGDYSIRLISNGTSACNTSDTIIKNNFILISNNGTPVSAICKPPSRIGTKENGIFEIDFNNLKNETRGSEEGYQDFTCSHQASVVEGQAYPIKIRTGTSNLENIRLWIDFNSDGNFNNTNELMLVVDNVSGEYFDTIIIPKTDSTNRALRMRIGSDLTNNPFLSACSPLSLGQYEDYTIIISPNNLAPIADFSSNKFVKVGDVIQFEDKSLNAPSNWSWRFPNAKPNNSSQQNPEVVYDTPGTFDVELIVSNAFGNDTILRNNYITVTQGFSMCTDTISSKLANGIIFDSGGANGNYDNNSNCSFLIEPPCATEISLTFTHFDLECCCDFLRVYDGEDSTGQLLFSGNCTTLPPNLLATSGKMYLNFTSDISVNKSGFEAIWSASIPTGNAPNTDFSISNTNPALTENIIFTDNSTNNPISWKWDFGDGNFSNEQNPNHSYVIPGNYSIQLITENCFEKDTISKTLTIQSKGEIDINPNHFNLNLACKDSITLPLKMYNKGLGDLIFNTNNHKSTTRGKSTFYDGFENGNLNAWKKNPANILVEITNSNVVKGNSALKFPRGNGNYNLSRTFPSDTIEYISFFTKTDSNLSYTSNEFRFKEHEFSGNEIINCYFRLDSIYVNPYISSGFSYPIDKEVWNFIEFKNIDYTLQNFDVYINKKLVKKAVHFNSFNNISTASNISINSSFYGDTFFDEIQIGGNNLGALPDWVSIEPDSASVAAGDSLTLQVTFNSKNLAQNSYLDSIELHSNDLSKLDLKIPIQINVSGSPEIELNNSQIDFGNVRQFLSKNQNLIIQNSGCDTLKISNLNNSSPQFALNNSGPINIPPYDEVNLEIRFTPNGIGLFQDTIHILNNAIDTIVTVSGNGQGNPQISIDPNSINASLQGCDDSISFPIKIYNSGIGDLNYEIIGSKNNAGLEPVLSCLNKNYTNITQLIPNRFEFTGGVSGTSIYDGGNNMYSIGNRMRTNRSWRVDYIDNMIYYNPNPGETGAYFTRKFPGLFVLGANLNKLQYFEIDGSIGGNLTGSVTTSILSATHLGKNYKGFVKQHYNRGVPSVCHLIIVEDLPNVTRTYSTWPSREDHRVSGLEENSRLYYLLYSNSLGRFIQDNTHQQIMDAFLENVFDIVDWVEVDSTKGIVLPSDSTTFNVKIKSKGLNYGNHSGFLSIKSDDPSNSKIDIPVNLNLIGNPILTLSDSIVNFDTIQQFSYKVGSLIITNEGCGVLNIDSIRRTGIFLPNKNKINIEPGASDTILIAFNPQNPGLYSDSLLLFFHGKDSIIHLRGFALASPILSILPDSLNVKITSCNDSVRVNMKVHNSGLADWNFNNNSLNSRLPRPASSPIEVLALQYGTDLSTEYPNTISGLSQYLSNYNLTEINTTDSLLFLNALIGKDVLIFPEFESANLSVLNKFKFSVLDFIDAGGTLITCGTFQPSVRNYIYEWNLFDGNFIGTNPGNINIDDPNHPIMDSISSLSVLSSMIENAFTNVDLEVFASNSNGNPIVASRTIGNGKVIYIAYDYYNVDANIQRLMANAIDYSSEKRDYINWIKYTPKRGILAPNDSVTISLTFYGTNIDAGFYNSIFNIQSNLPVFPNINIPFSFEVSGESKIQLNKQIINFPLIQEYKSAIDTIEIINQGCDTLKINSLQTNPPYAYQINKSIIPPYESSEIIVEFKPFSVGVFSDTLFIANNDVDTFVLLNGSAFGAPSISVNPNHFSASLQTCADSITFPLKIYNNGPTALNFDLQGFGANYDSTSIKNYPNVAGSTHHIFNIPNLQPDSFKVEITLNGDFDHAIEYATLFIEGINLGVIQDNNPPNGTDIVQVFSISGAMAQSFFSDNVLNIEVRNSFEVNTNFGGTDSHKVRVIIENASWLNVSPNLGTIPPNDSTVVQVSFNSRGLNGGTYFSNLSLFSDDPRNPVLLLPCSLMVSGIPCAAFNFDLISLCEDSVQFFDQSLNFPTRWHWDFGDGDTSNLQNPWHIYTASGNYKVVQTVYNSTGLSKDSLFININVFNANMDIMGVFKANETLNFSTTTSGAINWHWDFGDGNTSNLQNPNHIYSTRGTYLVKLLMENNLACRDSIERSIFIDSGVGIEDLADGILFDVFPNPNNGLFKINYAGFQKDLHLEILNPLGQMVYEQILNSANNGSVEIDLSKQSKGIYLIRLHSKNHNYSKKITILE